MRAFSVAALIGLLVLNACSSSGGATIPDADAAVCSAGTRVACDCGSHQGTSTCSSEGRHGGCDCGAAYVPPVDDGGAPEASCAKPTTFYRDADGDGFGSGVPTMACAAPTGYVATATDCDDADARAYPGQTAFFATARPGGSFDFNCDGSMTKEFPDVGGSCHASGGSCNAQGSHDYWDLSTVPDCGVSAQWDTACGLACVATVELRAQGCR